MTRLRERPAPTRERTRPPAAPQPRQRERDLHVKGIDWTDNATFLATGKTLVLARTVYKGVKNYDVYVPVNGPYTQPKWPATFCVPGGWRLLKSGVDQEKAAAEIEQWHFRLKVQQRKMVRR